MANKKHILWLYSELKNLISNQVIDTETSEKIKNYYGSVQKKEFSQIFLLVFGTIGAVLIGLGIILLIGYNWDKLARLVKTAIAFTLLIGAQGLGLFVLLKKPAAAVWKEGASVFVMLAVGACIALIGQIYHIPGDLDDFLFTWLLLTFPLIYIFNSNIVALLYLTGITSWLMLIGTYDAGGLFYWVFILLFIPNLYLKYKANKFSIDNTWQSWLLGVYLSIAVGYLVAQALPGLWMTAYASFFTILYLCSKLLYRDAPSFIYRHFYLIGAIGIISVALILTYSWSWRSLEWHNLNTFHNLDNSVMLVFTVIFTALLFAAANGLALIALIRKHRNRMVLGSFPLFVFLCYLLVSSGQFNRELIQTLVHLLLNLYLLTAALYLIVKGYKSRKLYLITSGVFLISSLIALRFVFVEDFFENLIVRGLIFIGLGVIFLVTNIFFSKALNNEKEVKTHAS